MTENIQTTNRFFWQTSLAGRFVILTVAIVMLLMGINAYVNYRSQKETILANLEQESK